MQTVNSRNARTQFSALLDTAATEPVEITRAGGKTSAVLMSRQDYDEYQALKRAQLEAEIDFIIDRHAHTFDALADR